MNGFETSLTASVAHSHPDAFAEAPGGVRERSSGVMSAPHRCPSCNSIVYARRHGWCGVCGRTLPKACLFSPSEARQVELLLNRERERHREWLRRR